jgi:hypothetical protein
MNASRREGMERVLNAESERWSSMSVEQVIAELRESQNYQVTVDAQIYQFEVDLLENTDKYVHVAVSVDDGRFLSSINPLTKGFIKQKS